MRWALLTALLLALILIPFFLFEPQFEAWGNRLVQPGGGGSFVAVLIGAFLALDVILPVPSSVVSTAAGVLLGFWTATFTVWAGMMAGCMLGYALGARSEGLGRRIVGAEGLARATRVADNYGDWAILVCRPVPVLAEASVILAGLARAPFRRFVLLTAGSNLGIAAAYAAIGAFSMNVGSFLLTFVGAIAVPALAMLAARLWLGDRGGAARG
jgi:uncharacterized membrane protein YdjX (TVP38/TMEM64 family)